MLSKPRKPAWSPHLPVLVRRAVAERKLFDGAACVVMGISGGADSMAMAHALAQIAARKGPRLVIAHLHHGIRGASADRDAAFVVRLADRLGVECIVERADVPALARRLCVSIEMAAREARHAMFRRALAATGADRVALAHTADDQAETVLLCLCRGSGSAGLSAMAPDTTIDGLRIVRPMLDMPREAIEAYLRSNRIAWRTDPSNRDPCHVRNRIRRRVLPMLAKELNPSIRDILRTTADILGAEDEWMDGAARRAFARARHSGGMLDAMKLASLPPALGRRVVREWLRAGGVPEDGIRFAAVERIIKLARAGAGRASLGSGREARIEDGRLSVAASRLKSNSAPWPATVLVVPGMTEISATGLKVSVKFSRGYEVRREPGPGRRPTVAWLAASKLKRGMNLTIRPWRAGDRYRPMGAPGTAKIHDILIDARVPREQRAGLPVVEYDGEIVWFPGHRVAHAWRVPSPSARSLRIELR